MRAVLLQIRMRTPATNILVRPAEGPMEVLTGQKMPAYSSLYSLWAGSTDHLLSPGVMYTMRLHVMSPATPPNSCDSGTSMAWCPPVSTICIGLLVMSTTVRIHPTVSGANGRTYRSRHGISHRLSFPPLFQIIGENINHFLHMESISTTIASDLSFDIRALPKPPV